MPLGCDALETITKSCDNNIGGIRKIWLNDQENITTSPVVAVDGEVITLAVSVDYTEFEINRNTGNYTEDTAVDLINGSSFVTQTITLMFNRREAAKSEAINILASGQRYLSALVLDANEKYWYFENLQLTATGEGSGTARADGSKYSVTLLAEANFLASEITSGAVASVTP
jgi:hypothetical protein